MLKPMLGSPDSGISSTKSHLRVRSRRVDERAGITLQLCSCVLIDDRALRCRGLLLLIPPLLVPSCCCCVSCVGRRCRVRSRVCSACRLAGICGLDDGGGCHLLRCGGALLPVRLPGRALQSKISSTFQCR